MELEENKKIGFFDQIIYSVRPSKYKELLKQPVKRVVLFMILLGLCLTIMNFVIPVTGWMVGFGGLDHLIMETLPKIEMKDGKLAVGSRIEMGEGGNFHILVDTDVKKVDEKAIDSEKHMVDIVVGEENAILYNSVAGTVEVDFTKTPELFMNNKSILAMKPFLYMLLIIAFISNIISEIIGYLVGALPFAVVEWVIGGTTFKERLKFSQIFILSLYAKTAAALFLAFNASAKLVSDGIILMYVAMFVTMYLLVTGIRKTEEAGK